MIRARNLTKIYGATAAVQGFSCDLPPTSVTGLLGANGAGKTTVMRMLCGYIAPSSGKAWLGGYDVSLEPLQARRMLGYLPEVPPLYPDMRLREYLDYAARLKGVCPRRSRVDEVIAMCRLGDVAGRKIAHLSRGYRQRAGLAQALISDPPVLIIDEPTSALDPLQIQETRNLLKELGKARTILISTHILSEVEQICDRVIILQRGETVLEGEMGQILRSDVLVLQAKADLNLLREKIEALPGVKSVATTWPALTVELQSGHDVSLDIWNICREYDWPVQRMEYMTSDLESVYLACTREERKV